MGKSLVSNPPYNMKWDIPPFAQIQPRFYYGTPPASNANFAFILTALNWIDDKAALLLPVGALSTDKADEKAIRNALIEANLIDAVIHLPDKMFESTSIETCIILFDKHKKTQSIECVDMRQTYEERQRDQRGQFGGASHENRTYHKTIKVISDEQISKAVKAVRERINEPGFSRSVSIEQVRQNEGLLAPSRYIESQEQITEHRTFADITADYNKIVRSKNAVKLTVNECLAKSLGLYDTFQMMQNQPDVSDSFSIVGSKAEKERYITLSKNAAEFKIENRDNERVPEMILLFLNMWKQHIMYLNNEQNKVLAEFRDALLPDLMSGKIQVGKPIEVLDKEMEKNGRVKSAGSD